MEPDFHLISGSLNNDKTDHIHIWVETNRVGRFLDDDLMYIICECKFCHMF